MEGKGSSRMFKTENIPPKACTATWCFGMWCCCCAKDMFGCSIDIDVMIQADLVQGSVYIIGIRGWSSYISSSIVVP